MCTEPSFFRGGGRGGGSPPRGAVHKPLPRLIYQPLKYTARVKNTQSSLYRKWAPTWIRYTPADPLQRNIEIFLGYHALEAITRPELPCAFCKCQKPPGVIPWIGNKGSGRPPRLSIPCPSQITASFRRPKFLKYKHSKSYVQSSTAPHRMPAVRWVSRPPFFFARLPQSPLFQRNQDAFR